MNIATRLVDLRQHIAESALAAGRDAASVRLMAVSKFQPAEAVREALQAGQRLFGENRVQEAKTKFPALRATFPDLKLHLIGSLQTNKAEEAVKLFDVIETLDRPALAEALARAMRKTGKSIPCYIEVNIGQEPQKAGIVPEQVATFLNECRTIHGLTITGLMCIPPQHDAPLPHFQKLKQLADQFGLPHISMGMSADFTEAIKAGSTQVRVGTALFGKRPDKFSPM